jgi:hypothetical protein
VLAICLAAQIGLNSIAQHCTGRNRLKYVEIGWNRFETGLDRFKQVAQVQTGWNRFRKVEIG